jgi:drug/metabolite transporter (DMT)-like permease
MTPDEIEARAKTRFFLLGFLRLFGALLMMAGFVLVMGKWQIAGPDVDRYLGIILVLVGAFDFALAPMLLARRWKRGDRQP